ncbi:YggS family pyridoxal phosphate-dependent enzyme [Streptococcus sp.]|nr:YggS family pyridoxal phosphate-dependent enzyme [Streptococcus sp.]MDY3824812.1 YggS family pyridoxal phosphate-dependent enzyme [Streptococcus sp.]
MDLNQNKKNIENAVAAACLEAKRSPESVKVIAVTKYVDIAATRQVLSTGIRHIGENRADKFLEKYQVLNDDDVVWHFIGTLQRRKVKDVINLVDYFHALDSVKLAREIDKRAEHTIKCFLQVNVSGEESKHGFSTTEVTSVLEELQELKHIELVGLMTMAPFDADDKQLQEIFSKTESLRCRLASLKFPNMPLTELSMGMTRDYPIAIKNGATFVRVGTAFFE